MSYAWDDRINKFVALINDVVIRVFDTEYQARQYINSRREVNNA